MIKRVFEANFHIMVDVIACGPFSGYQQFLSMSVLRLAMIIFFRLLI